MPAARAGTNTLQRGTVTLEAGSASDTALRFADDQADDGWYRSGANQWALSINGSQQILFSASAMTMLQPIRGQVSIASGFTFNGDTDTGFAQNGADRAAMRVGGSICFETQNNGGTLQLGFFGTAPAAQPAAYTPTNVTTDRAFDADASSVAELADVLGTLIADLQTLGLLA